MDLNSVVQKVGAFGLVHVVLSCLRCDTAFVGVNVLSLFVLISLQNFTYGIIVKILSSLL